MPSKIEINGISQILQDLENAGVNIENALLDSIKRSSDAPAEDLKSFMQTHNRSGKTLRSFTKSEGTIENGIIRYSIGFDVNKGGKGALFLDVGTPFIEPSYFIQNTATKYLQSIKDDQARILKERLNVQ